MRQHLQMRLSLETVTRGLLGMIGTALLALAFCAVPVRAGAARHRVIRAKSRVTLHKTARHRVTKRSARERPPRKFVRAKTAKAGLRSVSYKSYKKTPWRKRRIRYRRRRHHVTLPRAPARDRTEEIQSALERGGYYSGNPNGRWDGGTQEALRRFQTANGLPPTGKLDALSLQKLGLGSDVAGLSAPQPVMSGTQSSRQSSGQAPVSPAPKTPGR